MSKNTWISAFLPVFISIFPISMGKLVELPLKRDSSPPIVQTAIESQKTQSPEIEAVLSEKPISPLLSSTLKKLAWCESRGNDGVIVLDSNKKYSYGRYQWQEDSFWHYNQIYKVVPDLERAEVRNIIMDTTVQDELTAKVLQDGGWKNWYNCLKHEI